MKVQGYKKKTKTELLEAIDKCVSISQVCALVQHEGIVIQMQCFSLASNIPKKDLGTDKAELISPLETLKQRVKHSIEQSR